MSVYTEISNENAELLLAHYKIGKLVALEPISAGLENTNYFLTTLKNNTHYQWVITLIEQVSDVTVDLVTKLTYQLIQNSLPVAAPIVRNDGELYGSFLGKPCVVSQRYTGDELQYITPDHCKQVGEFLAKMHSVLDEGFLANEYFLTERLVKERLVKEHVKVREPDYQTWRNQLYAISDEITAEQQLLAEKVLQAFEKLPLEQLPQSIIHGDLFTDNVLFDGDTLSAVLDFYNATADYCVYDLAIAINDWCRDAHAPKGLNQARYEAFVCGYEKHRALIKEEQASLPVMLQAAALRFWFSRILTERWQAERHAKVASQKDPNERWQLLQQLSMHAG